MNCNKPLISVIIPAYNAEAFIATTISSVLNQTYKNIEVLVVDDGSQDQTPDIVEAIAETDPRLKLLRQANQGVAIARNLAIQQSQGEYIAPIDADDIWYPQKLEKQVECFLSADESVGLVYTWSVLVDAEDIPTGGALTSYQEGNILKPLIYNNFVGNASTPLIRRSCLEKIGNYNAQLKAQNAQGCEDWDIYLRIAEQYQFRVVPELLVGYRQLVGSMACNSTAMVKSYHLVMDEIQGRHPEISPKLFRWSASRYYCYLASLNGRCGQHGQALIWSYKALRLDWAALLLVYRTILKNLAFLVLKSLPYQAKTEKIKASVQHKRARDFDSSVLPPEIPQEARKARKPIFQVWDFRRSYIEHHE